MENTFAPRYAANQLTTGKHSCKSCISKETRSWSNITTLPSYDSFTFTSNSMKTTVRRLTYVPLIPPFVRQMRTAIYYIIPPLSLLTNSLSIAVFYRMRRRIQSELVLTFVALSVVDTFALVVPVRYLFATISKKMDLYRYNVLCQMTYWLSSSAQVCSSCLILLYTFERFISVRYPLKRAIICSGRRIRVAVLCILVFGLASQLQYLILYKYSHYMGVCSVFSRKDKHLNGYLKLYLQYVFGTIVPYCCVAFLNAMIVYHMIKYRKQRSALQASNMSSEEKTQRSMTIMLFTASTYSLIMMTPLMISRAMDVGHMGYSTGVFRLYYAAFYIISPWNYCGNFIFYVIGGRQFRNELVDMLLCRTRNMRGKYHQVLQQLT